MPLCCEVCSGAASPPSKAPRARVRLVLVGDRVIALCDQHSRVLRESAADQLVDARRLFIEPEGARSLLPRRAPLDRRVFPPRPEGRRRAAGRRTTDEQR